jgi:hypothetical protein
LIDFSRRLDETAADRRVLDEKGGGGIATLNLHHLFECIKRKPATDHVKNVEDPHAARCAIGLAAAG